MKIKITATVVIDVDTDHYPGCNCVEDIVQKQQEYIDEGDCSLLDILGDNYDVKVEKCT